MAGSAVGVAGVSEFADELLGDRPGIDLATAGDACAGIAERLPDPADASALIATVLWDVFSRTRAFRDVLAGTIRPGAQAGDRYVVRHPLFGGQPRHDLLVLHPGRRGRKPETAWIPPAKAWLSEGMLKYTHSNYLAQPAVLHEDWGRAIEEAASAQRFGMVVAEPPETMRLAGPAFLAPSAPLTTGRARDTARRGTAGVAARAADGGLVLTAALHALRESEGEAIGPGTEAWLGPMPAAVVATHEISDSALLRPGRPDELNLRGGKPLLGPLRGVTPRENQRVSFEGAISGLQHPFVTGWSPDLLSVTPYSQIKLLTTPETVPGDSGAALFDPDDNLLGFAFDRSGFNTRPEYSSWIWADSVVSFHELGSVELIAG